MGNLSFWTFPVIFSQGLDISHSLKETGYYIPLYIGTPVNADMPAPEGLGAKEVFKDPRRPIDIFPP